MRQILMLRVFTIVRTFGHLLTFALSRTPSANCAPGGVLQDKINDTPLYANVKRVVNKDGTLSAIEINYLTFYAHNGHYDVGYVGLFKVRRDTLAPDHCRSIQIHSSHHCFAVIWVHHRAAAVKVGAHDGDWEHITVRLSAETGALQVCLSNLIWGLIVQ
jgi:hypothetical protein